MSIQADERAGSSIISGGLVCADAPVEEQCIHELVEAQVAKTPDAVAVVYQGQQLTYRELDERADRLAAYLEKSGVKAETPVGICVERSLEMVVGVLGILKAGGYYVPLDPAYPPDRLAYMLEDTAAPVLLKQRHLLPQLPAQAAQVIFLDEVWNGNDGAHEEKPARKVSSEQLGIVLYTSGSTGRPKGIAMSHRALCEVVKWQVRRSHCGNGTKTAQFASLCFDVSFLEIFSALCSGGTLVLLSEDLQRDPRNLWRFLIDEQVEVLFVPVVALQQLARVAAEEETEDAPVCLRDIASSGEQLYITPEVVRLFQTLKGAEFYNLYGPTESHAAMEFRLEGEPDEWPARPPIGRAIAHAEIYLLDENLRIVPPDAEGEIYIGGTGLARGYLRRPDLTGERFMPDPFSHTPGARMYRTGDRARYLANGIVEYCGRVDHQLKIRGFRVEPEEIESELNSHPLVRAAVVVAFADERGSKRLAAYFVSEEKATPSGSVLRRFLQTRLPDYMIPSVFVSLQSLPVSPNGKLDRQALPAPQAIRPELDTDFVAPRTPLEEQLAEMWAEVLEIRRVGVEDNFFDLGGHSLLAASLLSLLRERLGVALSMSRLFESPTVAALAAALDRRDETEAREAVPSAPLPQLTPNPQQWHEPFPLADMQQAYWVGRSGAFELGGVATHLYVEIEFGEVSIARVESAIDKLVERHHMLRAIILPDGRQQVLEHVPSYEIRLSDLRGQDALQTEAQLAAVRQEMSHQVLPANQWPLFEVRASLCDGRARFHISYDLLIGDLRSLQILISEFIELYRNAETTLPDLTLSFRDYLTAEAALEDEEVFKSAKAYWQERLATMPPAPDLPLATHPGEISQHRFIRRSARLEAGLWQQLKAHATRYQLTPSVVLLAAYAEVLSAWSASPRFTVNLPVQNRLPLHPQVNDLVGDFTSLSLLTVDNSSPASFLARAQTLQQQLWDDLSHKHYSGTRVMRELAHAQWGTSRAVMPVVFTSALNLEVAGWITAAADEVVYSTLQTPQVWLDHQVGEHAGAIRFNWDAVEGLFPEGMLDEMFDAYCRLLHQLAENVDNWAKEERQLLSPAQVAQRETINDTAAPLKPTMLHTLFVEQAGRTPHLPAIISSGRNLTYAELNQCSDAIARKLRKLEAGRNRLVGVVMNKGWEQVVAVLGILKAGAAYLPVDPNLPAVRRSYLLADGEVEVVLTQPSLVEALEWPVGMRVEAVQWEEQSEESLESESGAEREEAAESDAGRWEELAYVIYTSGSTGFPKGVMIDHRGAVNTILDINRRFKINAEDRVLALSSLNFDLSVYDIFGTLAAGAAIVLPDAGDTRDPSLWVELIERKGVTVWNSVPALMEMLVEYVADQSLSGKLRVVMLSGDWIPVTLPEKIGKLFTGADIISLGGATEASIWSILHPVAEKDWSLPSIPYGRPMVNQTFHVLNDGLEPCPVWVAGELYIGGIGLAKGYWRDPAKTSASFITHPRTGERLYKTGDLGRWLPDGEIEFLGRRDFQVKLQGFRIELGEIEAALLQHPRVRSAVVTMTGKTSGEKRLSGFVVIEQESGTTKAVNRVEVKDRNSLLQELRQFLKERLPGHMIPADFVAVDEIPITPNGKVDRQALQALEPAARKTETSYALPATDIERTLISIFQELLGVVHLDTKANFFELGATSLHIVRAYNRLRELLDERLPIVNFFQYPTIKSLATNLRHKHEARAGADTDSVSYASAKKSEQQPQNLFAPRVQGSKVSSDIAVIGMACRFPGANNLAQFWENLSQGVESIQSFSDHELLQAGIAAQVLARPDYVKAGAVLEGIEEFDAQFFGMSPREAQMTDPQQRMFLEVAWEGLEDAGCDPQRYQGAIGVFAGANLSTYLLFNLDTHLASTVPGLPLLLSNDKDYLATHVSYKLNLRGPSLSIQTACSTSLVAIHMACQSLLNGECDIALAGGAAINVPQKTGYQYQEGGPVSPDGHCRAFDAQAQGTILGNGVGVVVLKRLDDALRDGDCIDAVVKGSAINNDGAAKVGFTAPSVDGQAKAIAQALARAQVEPQEIGYVEGHGTATPLGDPIEVAALCLAFSSSSSALAPGSIALGSVKSNVGHLDSAAGVAGFIKTVLSLKHRQLVPSLHCSHPNPDIDFARTPFYVNTALRHWPVSAGQRRRAGVSSFGIGGTNAHIVLEESPTARESHSHCLSLSMSESQSRSISESRSQSRASTEPALRPEPALYLLPLSARHPQALLQLAHSYLSLLGSLTQTTPAASTALLRDLCYSASLRRSHHRPHRLAALASSPAQLQRLLSAFVSDQPSASLFSSPGASQRSPALSAPAPKVVFIFSGQGAQWWGMGRYLLSHSRLFRQTIEECDHLLRTHTGEWSLLEELLADEEASRIDGEALEITQVCLFAVQVGLARLWQSYGVEPFAVIGHSMGEVAAAAVAGKLTLSEAVRVIYERSRLLQEVAGSGAMAAVELSGEEAGVLVRGKGGRVSVAAVNGRRASVISGEREAVQEMVRELEERGVMAREVRSGGVGGHSGEVERLREELKEALGGLQESEGRGERREREREEGERAGSEASRGEQSEASRREQSERGRGEQRGVMMISTVEVREVESEELGAGYWWRNMREGVRFGEAVREAARKGAGVYVEMNAHPVLGLWVREAAQEVAQEAGQEAGRGRGAGGEGGGGGECGAVVIGAMRRERGEREVLMEGLGEAYAAGVEVGWEEVWREAAGEAAGERAGGGAGERGEAGGADEAEGGAEERGARGEQQSGEQPREREERREAARGEERGAKYVRLPGYAWQRQRFWVEEGERAGGVGQKVSHRLAGKNLMHPLLGQRLSSPLLKDFVFESWFSVSATDFFDDHRVYDAAIVSATTYVELAMAAAVEAFGARVSSVADVVIQEAMMLPENEGRVVQVVVSGEEEGEAAFQIFSRVGDDEEAWSLHASGNVRLAHERGVDARHEHFTLESLRARFDKELPLEIFDSRTRAGGVSYGPSFQGIEKIWSAENEALGYIALPELSEAEKYHFHPAVLDLCFQVVEAARSDELTEEDCYLPLSLERFRSFARPDKALWSYVYIHPERSRETFAADIVVFDTDGEVICEVEGLRFKRADKETLLRGRREGLEDWLYELQWQPSPLAANGRDCDGRWLIVAQSDGFVESLVKQLKARGGQPVLISPGEIYQGNNGHGPVNSATAESFAQVINQHLNQGAVALRGVVYLCGAEISSVQEIGVAEMLRLMESCCEGALRVLQGLINTSVKQMPRLWLVTRGAQQFTAHASPEALAQSALWGLGRTIALEHPELKVSLIDMSEPASDDDEATLLLEELLVDDAGEQVSLRGREKYVARLVRRKRQDVPRAQISLRADATYLITGGLGGIGLKLSRWMVERGARHLVLCGRSGASASAREVLSELEKLGAEVLVAQADVADREQMIALRQKISSQMPPLRGIFHAALVLDDGVLLQQDAEKLRKVLSPKAAGAWNLHLLACDVELDFFVLFSSVLSVLGGSGQGNYTAASAFVDALAGYRRARGLPAISINWGPWSYEGSASAEVIEQHTQLYDGFTSITPQHGLEALGRLLHLDGGQIGVMPFDWREWSEIYPAAGATLLSQLAADEAAPAQQSRRLKDKPALTHEALLNAEASQREELLRAYLQGIVARRLGVSPSTFGVEDTFIRLGLDSLMTLEIRNRIVDDLRLTIPPVKFIENPTIARLAAAIYERWQEIYEPVTETIEQGELMARLALLSDEEVDSSLRDILASANQQ